MPKQLMMERLSYLLCDVMIPDILAIAVDYCYDKKLRFQGSVWDDLLVNENGQQVHVPLASRHVRYPVFSILRFRPGDCIKWQICLRVNGHYWLGFASN